MKEVAVIILNWNGADLLRRFLPSVVEHTPESIADVIVADNGSTDNSLDVLAADFPTVKVISFDRNYGFAEGYNRAIAATRYPYTVLLNSDVEVDSDWLSPLYEYMKAHPDVAAAQPKILAINRPGFFEYAGAAGGYLDRNGFAYCRGRLFDTVEPDTGQYDTVADVHWASGAALMVVTERYLALGGLDASFFAHMEEIDLCWRMRLAGWRVVAVPAGRVKHLGGASLSAASPRKTYLNFRNSLLMLHKNLQPGPGRWWLMLRRRLLDTVAGARLLVSGQPSHALAVARAHIHYIKMRRNYPTPKNTSRKPNLLGSRNILIDYYLRRRKRFSDLSTFN